MPGKGQLYFGGDIYTVDEACPTAEAIAVRDERILAVGSESQCQSALGKHYESINLYGCALLPGFIDTHLHPILMIYFDMNLDLRGVKSIKDLQDRIRNTAEESSPDTWVVGLQFDDQELHAPRLPTRRDLDAACLDHPVIVVKHDGHMVIANTKAIEAAGISASTKDPEAGIIDREQNGYPSGPFRESAAQILLDAMPLPDMQSFIAGAALTFKKLVSHGITSAGVVLQTDEEGPAGAQGAFDLPLMQMLLEYVPINLYGILFAHDVEQIAAARETALHQQEIGIGHRIGGLKIIADGTFGSCTAYMSHTYTDQPDKQGFLMYTQDEIYQRMVAAHNAGFQIAIHAIGDAGNRTCIDLYDRLLNEYPRVNHRHRLEHASLLDASMIADIARLGLVVSAQPLFIHSEKSWLHKRLGADRARWTYPFRTLLDAGIKVAGASDSPIESIDVLHAIQCCVTREGFEPQQGITTAEAIRMFTLDAAYAQFEESVKGSISVGKRADMVVLSENPTRVSPEKIRGIHIKRTISGGKVLYQD